jgi:hypothetical protein
VVYHQILVHCLKKTTSKSQSSGNKEKRSGRDACRGEGSDLSYYIPEVEEPDDVDYDMHIKEEPTPLANEVHLLSWLWGGGCRD